ncbi:hypothetical protein SCLCIDRAFT_1208901 [Scleroderma citrinum Foug A]|uniref:Uncharacterized protein n=1 Tax=Scleroderma citrinum Foug A TaxID=1036808 RepID=A0A0C3AUS0_9AGAM|nr:hypothetical protein SCLCIDRAFT_1208901 [Scleroderma citrinum Foug A]
MATSEHEPAGVGFFSLILKPGSSLHPTFLLVVDCAFTALFFVFVWLAFLTRGNIHFFVLMIIELLLWGSVKWFVQELQRLPQGTADKKKL